jgi:lipopolysaccharide transport system permease protein
MASESGGSVLSASGSKLAEGPKAPAIVIEPATTFSLRLRELWDYRELLYFLFWRDMKVRYKQTLLGGAWAIMQPVVSVMVFTVFFGRLVKVSSDGIPYPLFALTGLLPWQLFAFSLNAASSSLVNNAHLLTKVYFPRLVIPVSSVLVGLVDFAVSAATLLILMIYYQVLPTARIFALPLLVVFAVLAALGIGIFLSALNVKYRDVRHTLPFLTQMWMFATPIVYPSSLVPDRWRPLYGLNPMAGVVEGFRWALFGTKLSSESLIGISVVSVIAMLVGGLFYFRTTERQFADLV